MGYSSKMNGAEMLNSIFKIYEWTLKGIRNNLTINRSQYCQ